MISDGLSVFQRSAIEQICRDTSGSEGMAAGGIGQSRFFCPALDHLKNVEPAHRVRSQIVALVDAAEQWLFLFRRYARCLDPIVKMYFQTWMTRHLVPLTAFFMEPQPSALAVLKIVPNPQRNRRTDSCETIDHDSDQCPVSQTN
jgi:hypothetical protein